MFRKSLIALIVMVMCIMGSILYGVAIGFAGSSFQDELPLDSRGKDYVMAGKMRILIESNTIIQNRERIDVTIEELSIPGMAIVRYYKESNQSNTCVALSIQEVPEPE